MEGHYMDEYMSISENFKMMRGGDKIDKSYMEKPLYEIYDNDNVKCPSFIAPKFDYYVMPEGYTTTYNTPVFKKPKSKKIPGCC